MNSPKLISFSASNWTVKYLHTRLAPMISRTCVWENHRWRLSEQPCVRTSVCLDCCIFITLLSIDIVFHANENSNKSIIPINYDVFFHMKTFTQFTMFLFLVGIAYCIMKAVFACALEYKNFYTVRKYNNYQFKHFKTSIPWRSRTWETNLMMFVKRLRILGSAWWKWICYGYVESTLSYVT